MGLIGRALELVFGSGGNLVRETAEVFRENAENGAQRAVQLRGDALAQFAKEFRTENRGLFDRIMDALNRIPRPAMALGTLGLFTAAMIDPIWFASRMQGIALVPEPLWWLLGAIVSFYFGARHQVKNQHFQKQVAASLALTPEVMRNIDTLDDMAQERRASPEQPAPTARTEPPVISAPPALNLNVAPRQAPGTPASVFPNNAALRDWALNQ